MVFETVERIALSCSVLTKLETLEAGAAACEIVGVATVGVESVESVFWFTGIRKIHLAASNIVSIECGSDGE